MLKKRKRDFQIIRDDMLAMREDMLAMREDMLTVSEVLKDEIVASEKRTKEYVGEKIEESEGRMNVHMTEMKNYFDGRLTESENLVLQHVEDTRKILERNMKGIERKVDEISQYYRIRRLEEESAGYLIKKMKELDERVNRLEKIG